MPPRTTTSFFIGSCSARVHAAQRRGKSGIGLVGFAQRATRLRRQRRVVARLPALPLGVAMPLLGHLHADLGERSEEHTSELQSRENLVCRLLLEKKKTRIL